MSIGGSEWEEEETRMPQPRAFASAVMVPRWGMWIMGGLPEDSMVSAKIHLFSTQYLAAIEETFFTAKHDTEVDRRGHVDARTILADPYIRVFLTLKIHCTFKVNNCSPDPLLRRHYP